MARRVSFASGVRACARARVRVRVRVGQGLRGGDGEGGKAVFSRLVWLLQTASSETFLLEEGCQRAKPRWWMGAWLPGLGGGKGVHVWVEPAGQQRRRARPEDT